MNLTNFRVTFSILQLITRECLAVIIIKTLQPEDSLSPTTAMVQVLKSCHGKQTNTIGFAGNWAEDLNMAALLAEEHFSAVLLGNTGKILNDVPVTIISKHKLHIFVITSSSSVEFEEILVNIKNSRWWNHMAYFYILDRSQNTQKNTDGCSRAYEILWTAWRMNILEAKFFCTHSKKGPLIYNFNPYTKDAPDPWKLDKIYRSDNDHPWTLLVRKYPEDRDNCENMNFDKTKDIGGYEIRTGMVEKMWNMHVDIKKTGLDSIDGPGGYVVRSIFHAMNATAKVITHGLGKLVGPLRHEGKVIRGVLQEVRNGISDIAFIDCNLLTAANFTRVYPFYSTRLAIMTQDRGYATELIKIVTATDVNSRIAVSLIFLVTFIYLKFVLRQAPITAILNIIRLICNVSFTKLPKRLGPRIYLTSIFVGMIIIQALHQGKVASLLSKRESEKNVETLSDLTHSDHTIYSYNAYAAALDYEVFKGRYIGIPTYNCTEYVLHESSAACVATWPFLVLEAARTKLHLSEEFFIAIYNTWVIRKDWPLEQRVNQIIQRLVESHFIRHTYGNIIAESLRILNIHHNKYKDKNVNVLTITDLRFAFVILGVGLACAAISFIVELMIGRGRLKNPSRNLFRHNSCI